MKWNSAWSRGCIIAVAGIMVLLLAGQATAAPPIVKTVPWVATNPLVPHDTYLDKTIILKGTTDVSGANIQYTWDFGDGSPVSTGTVTNPYVVQATHAYTAPAVVGTVFTARLTIQNTTTGETGSKEYYVAVRERTLPVEVNIAIDDGLWYLHKTQRRTASGGIDYGDWLSGDSYTTLVYYGLTAANTNAFEANGHLETGSVDNPYTETVARALKSCFSFLTTIAIGNQTNPLGTFSPDSNGNGYGVFVNQSYPYYQGGMFMDAIVASGTPNAVTSTGPAPSGANPGILGRTYKNIVQDMADAYSYAQYDSTGGGGWRYSTNEFPDNSACQWAAIGLIAAQRGWGVVVPSIVKNWNLNWIGYSQAASGAFGYTQAGYYPWGPYALTPSGMVQLAMDGVGRGDARWDKAETFMRDNFGNGGGAYSAVRDYYYGLFSFVKALLLHDSNGDGIAEPIHLLQSATPGVAPVDWYSAQVATGDPLDGVARTLVGDQNPSGFWYGHNYEGNQYRFETAWALIMLNKTIFESGAPVAVAEAVPNPGVVGQMITLKGSSSFHQDPALIIDSWEWDLDNDGTFDVSGPIVTTVFGAIDDYPVTLRVTDDGSPERSATTTITVRITTPPIAPTADAGGPYSFCPLAMPWFLDGTQTVNPDEGDHQAGYPGDTIQEYAWDLDGDGQYDDAFGPQPDVTAYFSAKPAGAYLIQLRVTDTTSTSFPGSGYPDLTDTDSAEVYVREGSDQACSCVTDLVARGRVNQVQLAWTHIGASKYAIYRGTINGGPYLKIGETNSTYSTYIDPPPIPYGTYYYVVRPVAINGIEVCQSNQAVVTLRPR
ncbi:MAG: hypothetical protein EHM18_00010 [Acidobacteria bacterium]|nr:MAG: hypothetical protein EHM18_00010 [Acidobacteriota bacterium]